MSEATRETHRERRGKTSKQVCVCERERESEATRERVKGNEREGGGVRERDINKRERQ